MTNTTTSDPKVDAIRQLYAAVGSNDINTIVTLLDDDVEWSAEAASTSVPWYGTYRGPDEVPAFFAALGSNIDITEFTPLDYCWNDTDVIVPVRWAYTVKTTGRRAEMTMLHWWRFAGDKIVRFRGAEDTEQSAAAFA